MKLYMDAERYKKMTDKQLRRAFLRAKAQTPDTITRDFFNIFERGAIWGEMEKREVNKQEAKCQ